jgi:hypothetical protein
MYKLILTGLTMALFSCTAPRYLYVDSDILQKDIAENGKMPVKRYILSPDNFPADSMTFIKNEPTKSFLNILKSNNPKKVLRFIQSTDFSEKADSLSKPFCLVLYYMISSNYDSCVIQISHLNDKAKTCFIKFLMTDCEYETGRTVGSTLFNEYVEKYQKVLDCSDNEFNREIVKNRLKLIRYGY